VREIETRSTSRRTALCNPITLRETDRVRLAFVPAVVDNHQNANACIDGQFVYQRKAASGNWIPMRALSLSTLREGDGFKLSLHAQELLTLLEGLVPLYKLHRLQGVPRGRKRFVEVDSSLADFIARGEKDLTSLLKSQSEDAATLLLKLVNWLATSSGRREAAQKLTSMVPEQMPNFSALLGLASIKDALKHWQDNRSNPSEEFWQRSFSERAFVLSQLFAYPVVVIGKKAYVGGKQLSNRGGKEVDFLLSIQSTDALIVVEIKTPQTKLLASEYREGVFPLSRELSSAIAQVLRYRQNLIRRFDSLQSESPKRLTLGEPRCIVLAGDSDELTDQPKRENFELRESGSNL
jgi:hypothetical protein